MKSRFISLLFIGLLFVFALPSATLAQGTPPIDSQIEVVETYVKIIGGIIAGLVAVFGLPLTVIQFQKTRAEIRKLDLEAAALEGKGDADNLEWPSNMITIEDSDYATVQILADPRFLGPLLLLLDFIIAWIVLSLFNYALSAPGAFLPLVSLLHPLILLVIAAILLVPIALEAYRVRQALRKDDESPGSAENTA